MIRTKNVYWCSLLLSVVIFIIGCSKSEQATTVSDYDKLCQIYTEVLSKGYSPAEREMMISDKIEKNIPKLYTHYKNILLTSNDVNGYDLYKKLAEKELKSRWDCPAMKGYFNVK